MKKADAITQKNRRAGWWIILVAAIVLEAISCVQYFTSRHAIRVEAERRAKTELRRAELEISLHTIELETAAKTLALLAEKHVDCPDSIYAATRLAVSSLRTHTSMAVAYVPDYFPKYGKYFEVCSSRITEDSVYTRQIGSAEHDYTELEWFQNGLKIDSCWWGDPYLDDSGSRAYVVSCSYPVRDRSGKVVAVVCVDLSLNELKNLSDYLQVYPNSYYTISSSTGMDIVPIPDTVPGRKYNIFDEEIDATGWHITIIIPEDVLFADLNRIGRIVGIMMIIGLLLLLFIVWHAGKSSKELIETTAKNQRLENELQVASMIQDAMLPKVFPPFHDHLDVNIYGLVDPAKEIGGDLYDFYIRHNKLFFCVGDVSGKGVPAALVMAMTRSLFRSSTAHEEQPEYVMAKMNRAFVDQNSQNMFMTLFLGVLDCKTGELEYCNAGHNAPMIRTKGEWKMIEVLPNLPLGIVPDFEYQAQRTHMDYNDMLFLYTDGLTEAENTEHEQFGEQRMQDSLSDIGDRLAGPREIVAEMKRRVETFVDGAEQSDDLTMLCVRYQTPALIMRNDIQQIPTLAEWIEGLGIPDELNMPINLALEEIVSNVMLYAYPGTHGQVIVEYIKVNDERILFTISDTGIAFDPTKKEEVDTTLSAEERPIGGLGIHLVRQLMDEVRYERIDDKNVLTLIKNI